MYGLEPSGVMRGVRGLPGGLNDNNNEKWHIYVNFPPKHSNIHFLTIHSFQRKDFPPPMQVNG